MTTLREAAQAALRIIELRRNLGNAEYDKQAEQAANDLRAVLAVESVRAALAEFDASLTDPALASVHQTAEPAQPVAWRHKTDEGGKWLLSNMNPEQAAEWNTIVQSQPLYAAPQPPADEPVKPVAWFQIHNGFYAQVAVEYKDDPDVFPLYAAPPALAFPARLTDEDFGVFWLASTSDVDVSKSFAALALHYGRAVEAEVLRRMGVVE